MEVVNYSIGNKAKIDTMQFPVSNDGKYVDHRGSDSEIYRDVESTQLFITSRGEKKYISDITIF